MTPAARIRKLSTYIDRLLEFEEGKNHPKVGRWIEERIRDESYLAGRTPARRRLRRSRRATGPFPAAQVILLDEKRTYQVELDEAVKVMNLPTWKTLRTRRDPVAEEALAVLRIRAPTVQGHACPGSDQSADCAVRHVEAIRIFAAEHRGPVAQELGRYRRPAPHRSLYRQALPI